MKVYLLWYSSNKTLRDDVFNVYLDKSKAEACLEKLKDGINDEELYIEEREVVE